MMMRSALYLTNTLSWIFIVLIHWNNSPLIDMSPHSATLSWFRANQSFLFLPIRNKNCLWRPCFFTVRDEMCNLYKGPSIDDSYHVSVHLAKQFQSRRFFRNRPIRNKNCLSQPCLLTDWGEMCNFYRGPSIDASYPVSVHLAKWF